jgi:ATPase subunit of ABC transporter with duplicated ATPase domains
LLSLLAGALEPTSGRVARAPGVRVGWVPQRPAYYERLTARENLALFARLEGEPEPAQLVERLLVQFDVPPDRPAARLSWIRANGSGFGRRWRRSARRAARSSLRRMTKQIGRSDPVGSWRR